MRSFLESETRRDREEMGREGTRVQTELPSKLTKIWPSRGFYLRYKVCSYVD
jgi:hypothetical protein